MERFWVQEEHETDVEGQGVGVTTIVVVVDNFNYRSRGLSTPSLSPFSLWADEDDPDW